MSTELDDLVDLLTQCRRRAKQHGGWELRKQLSEAHEAVVRLRVRQAGWVCDHWGQALLTEELRTALRGTSCPARWAPDLVAVRGREWRFVEAKADTSDTPTFSIEKATLSSHVSWYRGHNEGPAGFVYVWDDFRCSYIGDLTEDNGLRAGQYQGRGSGTPFWLFPKTSTRPFDEVFG